MPSSSFLDQREHSLVDEPQENCEQAFLFTKEADESLCPACRNVFSEEPMVVRVAIPTVIAVMAGKLRDAVKIGVNGGCINRFSHMVSMQESSCSKQDLPEKY
jgi:hypothetical protein